MEVKFLPLVLALLGAQQAMPAPVVDLAVPSQIKATPASKKLAEGYSALAKQDFATAEVRFKEAASLDVASPAPYLALAESARIRNQPEQVRKWLADALKLGPNDSATLAAWGSWHFAARDYAKAEQFWTSAVVADPKATGPLLELGGLFFNVRNKPEAAGAFYRKALAIDPQLGGAHFALGSVLGRTGKPAEAIAEFQEAAKLSPGNPLPYQAIGRVELSRNEHDAALKAFEMALKVEPKFYAAHVDKGDVLMSRGKFEEALAEYKLVTNSQPKFPEAHVKAGMALQSLGRAAEALAEYQAALKVQPNLAVALNNMAWISADRNLAADRGLSWAERAVSLNRDEPRFKGTLAWVLLKRGEPEKALNVLEPLVLGAGKTIPESHYMLGVAYSEIGDKGKAAASLREALRLDPAFSFAADTKVRLKKLIGG